MTAHTQVGADLVSPYTPPAYTQIGADVGYTPPSTVTVFFTGTTHTQFGNTLWPLRLGGQVFTEYGLFTILVPPNQIITYSGQAHTTFGSTTRVSNFRKFVAPQALTYTQFGLQWFSLNPTHVAAQGVLKTEFGGHLVGTSQTITPIGVSYTLFGTHEFERNSPDMQGFVSSEFGQHAVIRARQDVRTLGETFTVHGAHVAYNKLQFVNHYNICPSPTNLCDASFGDHTIRNLTRVVRMDSLQSAQFSFFAFNIRNGQVVFPARGASHTLFGDRFSGFEVDFAVRARVLGGLNATRFPDTVNVFVQNRDRGAIFQGQSYFEAGAHTIVQTRFINTFGSTQTIYGTSALVRGPAVLEYRAGTPHTRYGAHLVANNPHLINLDGIDSAGYGWSVWVARPMRTIAPVWEQISLQDLRNIGELTVRNVVRNLWLAGLNSLRAGEPIVYLNNREFTVGGILANTRFGSSHVKNADVRLVLGAGSTFMAPLFDIWTPQPPPPILDLGIAIQQQNPHTVFGAAFIGDKSVRFSGAAYTQYGLAVVTSDNVFFQQWHHPRNSGWTVFGNATFFGGADVIEFSGIEPTFVVPKFSCSPHTIWCTHDTPQQARQNHPGQSWCDVDYFCNNSGLAENMRKPHMFGSFTVSTPKDALLRLGGNLMTHIGAHTFALRDRRTSFTGFLGFRPGFPIVGTPTTRIVRMWSGTDSSTSYGSSELFDTGVRNISYNNHGFAATLYGGTVYGQQPHDVLMPLTTMTVYGNNDPMVHFERTITPIVLPLTTFGLHWISLGVRELDFAGVRPQRIAWTIFGRRMRVALRTQYIRGTVRNTFTRIGAFGVTT